jgi:hypothetical protein
MRSLRRRLADVNGDGVNPGVTTALSFANTDVGLCQNNVIATVPGPSAGCMSVSVRYSLVQREFSVAARLAGYRSETTPTPLIA